MTLDSPFLGIPASIRRLQRFGVGTFSPAILEKKCLQLREMMQQRDPISAPRFSVIIPAHRETGYLLATLRSLAQQTFQNAEFIIVSNGEPRGNPTERLAKEAGFRVIHERKRGVARARQIGLQAARGTIIVTTDADTVHLPHWLEAIDRDWGVREERIAGFGPVHELSPSLLHQSCSFIQNMTRSFQNHHFFLIAAEANSWYLREAALTVGGYETAANYWEGSILLKKLTEFGELHCATDKRTGVYTSDRRTLSERFKAGTQYLCGIGSQNVQYAVIR